MFANTREFCREAIYFEKHGRYPDGTIGSIEWDNYWDEQHKRCQEGYKVAGTYITGEHYYYLNFHPIMKVEEKKESEFAIAIQDYEMANALIDADRIEGFPDFWDLDYEYFIHLEKAKRLGKHILWLKGRGCGASFKGSALLSKNYHFKPKSKGYAMADNEDFLIDDGILTKFLIAKSFLYKYTEFGKASDFKAAEGELKWRASLSIEGTKQEEGFMSEVMGVALGRDWNKARGKRGEYVLFEEGGKFPNMDLAWSACRDSLEQGKSKFGTMIGFGTGGTDNKDFGPMSEMFYNPEAYGILPCQNIWDEGMSNTLCGYFTPAYHNIDFKDKDGNTNKQAAKEYFVERREIASKSSKPIKLAQEKAEQPFCPQDAILTFKSTKFPKEDAKKRRSYIISTGDSNLGIPGVFRETSEGVIFEPSDEVTPLTTWKYKQDQDRTGCPVIYTPPHKINGQVPNNLYIIGHDPYDKDDKEGPSVGAAYVYCMPNDYNTVGKRIVATYFGRPESLDEYNFNLFALAKYYNAKIGFENDRGDVIGYAKRLGLLSWLQPEFKLAFDVDVATKKFTGKFGMHMGSGKLNKRKTNGDTYLSDFFREIVAITFDGVQLSFINTLNCTGTLEEIAEYDDEKGNYDRISALRVLIYFIKELLYKKSKPKEQKKQNSKKRRVFKSKMFQ